jgi:hypothetical protein
MIYSPVCETTASSAMCEFLHTLLLEKAYTAAAVNITENVVVDGEK